MYGPVNPQSGCQVNDSMRRTQRTISILSSVRMGRSDSNLELRRIDVDGRIVVAVREKRICRRRSDSIKKGSDSLQRPGRWRCQEKWVFDSNEGRYADRGSVVREAQKAAIGDAETVRAWIKLSCDVPGFRKEKGKGRSCSAFSPINIQASLIQKKCED
jgi:hypothetical protein